ncbi:MAG: urea ABC transporter ATP-binding subunit UrtE [Pirellulales bacterium]|nr:urea ABC transporter ATP-binding subunit UrtE [Pirellulales bacterium]
MLTVENLSFAYGTVGILRDINMQMQTGRVTCVIGRNGVGKTTLLKNIIGLLKSSGGTVRLDEKDISSLPANKRARAGLGFVPQGRQIFPKLTVEENLRVGLEARNDRQKNIPDEIYTLFPVLKEMTKRRGGDLSGGQQQQLSIGRALVGNPKVLVLDEPTEGIQPNIIQQIGHVLRDLVESRDVTVILVEQYLDFVREFGHDFYIMDRGQVIESGETQQLTEEMVQAHLSV